MIDWRPNIRRTTKQDAYWVGRADGVEVARIYRSAGATPWLLIMLKGQHEARPFANMLDAERHAETLI